MTREEWYASPKFLKLRLLNNLVAEMGMKQQQLYDMLRVLDADCGPLVGDIFSLVELQLRVTNLEIEKLQRRINKMYSILTPEFTDLPREGHG